MWDPELILGKAQLGLITRDEEVHRAMVADELRWTGGCKVRKGGDELHQLCFGAMFDIRILYLGPNAAGVRQVPGVSPAPPGGTLHAAARAPRHGGQAVQRRGIKVQLLLMLLTLSLLGLMLSLLVFLIKSFRPPGCCTRAQDPWTSSCTSMKGRCTRYVQ